MNRFLLPVFFFACVFCISFTPQYEPEIFPDYTSGRTNPEDVLHGNVKSVVTREFSASGTAANIIKGEPQDIFRVSGRTDYNGNNLPLLSAPADPKEAKCTRTVFTYDAKNRPARRVMYSGCRKGETSDYHYNASGRLEKITCFEGDDTLKPVYTISFSYTSSGQLAEEKKNDVVTASYTYGQKNNVVSKSIFKNGKLSGSETYAYNDSGQVTTRTAYDSWKTVTGTWTYTRDAKGDMIRDTFVAGGAKNDTTVNTRTFTYNSSGQLVEEEDRSTADKSVFTMKFTYDAQGNCTRKVFFSDGKPQTIIERKIEYN
ncbi:MAG TPA: hypothetical protein VFU15_08700 [Bacteroidia bacterium]|nr:hypothetical protein [Bacteroidia bacterium]